MEVTYKNEILKYIDDFHGEPVLWITDPSQRNMERMTFVGGYPNEYAIYLRDLSQDEREDIYRQLKH